MNPTTQNQHPDDTSNNPAGLVYSRNSIQAPERPTQPQTEQSQQPGDPYNRTHQPTYDWQQYHSAWQQYYQQYYQRYYAYYAPQPTEQPQADDEPRPNAPEMPTSQTITGSDNIELPKTRFQQVRDDLLQTVSKRAEKLRSSNHFVPIMSALIVALLFLGLQFNRVFVAQIEAYISPGSTVDVSDTIVVDPAANPNVSADPKLIIPKINVNVPVIYNATTVDNKIIQSALEKGVVHYNLSGANSVPGQAGNGVILGHSSNDVFDPGNYKFAFLLLDRLSSGDLFYLNYQGKRYVYKVSDKKVISPTDWRILQQDTGKPTTILATCAPAGSCQNRLLVYGQQISPDPATANAKPANAQDTNPAEIPGNSPTLFERLGNLFF
jgi:sortase A